MSQKRLGQRHFLHFYSNFKKIIYIFLHFYSNSKEHYLHFFYIFTATLKNITYKSIKDKCAVCIVLIETSTTRKQYKSKIKFRVNSVLIKVHLGLPICIFMRITQKAHLVWIISAYMHSCSHGFYTWKPWA
jgi:hypothetical protein